MAEVMQVAEAAGLAARKAMHRRKIAAGVAMSALTAGAIVGDYFIGLDICFHVIIVGLTIKGLLEFYEMCESSRTAPFRGLGIASAVILILSHWAATPGTLSWFSDHLWGDFRWLPAQVSASPERPAPGQLSARAASGPGSVGRANAPGAAPLGEEFVWLGLVVAVLGSLWLQAMKRDNDRTFEAISTTLFGILYVWFLASFLVKLRHLGSDGMLGGEGWNRTGTGLLVSCLAVSKLSDVGGYFFGRKFGRHKMIPRISPNKSYEGLVAGLALSVGAAYALWGWGLLPLAPSWAVAMFGLLVGGMGTMGDLAESLLKRGSGRKDTDDLVPGFGGVLDVYDSLLLSAPVAFFLSILLLRAGAGT